MQIERQQKTKYLPLLVLDSIEEICQEFSLGKLIQPPEENSSNNESFAITTESGKYQIKSYARSTQDPDNFSTCVQREINFTRYLEQEQIPVQHHLAFQPFIFQGKITTLTTFLPGTALSLEILTSELIEKIGTLVAKLHKASEQYGQAGAITEYRNSNRDRVEENIIAIEDTLQISRSQFLPLLDVYETLREEQESRYNKLPKGLIHSDIVPGNLLQTKNSLAIIDFAGLRFDPFVFDFGPTITTLTWSKGTFNKEFVHRFFSAYGCIRPLIQEEKAAISEQLVYNYLHKLEWRLSAALTKPGYIPIVKEQIEDADMFIEQAKEIMAYV